MMLKRPRDPNQLAKSNIDIVTGQKARPRPLPFMIAKHWLYINPTTIQPTIAPKQRAARKATGPLTRTPQLSARILSMQRS